MSLFECSVLRRRYLMRFVKNFSSLTNIQGSNSHSNSPNFLKEENIFKVFKRTFQTAIQLSIEDSVKKNSKRKQNAFVEICESVEEVTRDIKSGDTLLVGGFGLVGVPENLIKSLAVKEVKDLNIISNEGGVKQHGLDILLEKNQVKKITCSFIGQNKEFEQKYLSGQLEVELVPQVVFMICISKKS